MKTTVMFEANEAAAAALREVASEPLASRLAYVIETWLPNPKISPQQRAPLPIIEAVR